MKAVRRLRGFLPVGGVLLVITPQDFPDVLAGPGDGESAGGGLPRCVQGLLPGSMVSSESECTAESSSESSTTRFCETYILRNNIFRWLANNY